MISEPMTLATDYLLAVVVALLARRLWQAGGKGEQLSVRLWGAAFFASALAALSGGTYHGFTDLLGPGVALTLWKLTVYAVGLASLLLTAAAIRVCCRGRLRTVLLAAAGLKFVVYGAWMATHNAFAYVIYDYAPALVAVLLMMAWGWWRRREPAAPWVVGGILVAFGAAAIQMSGLSLHRHFNHNDLYHLVQIGSFWLLYRGGLLLRDAPSP